MAINNTPGGRRALPTLGDDPLTPTRRSASHKMTDLEQLVQDEMRRKQIIGKSKALLMAIERAIRVAPSDTGVLITGENGTGKENLARIIHDNSSRRTKKYVTVNCGALPEGTINSELFGHKKGSFTSADTDHAGFFEKADGGTIFLDEVADLPLPIQVLLLRVIEYGEFYRMGETTPRKTNVRIIAATNRDMRRAVEEGKFREDLFYRLAGVQIKLPALRERSEDIRPLFDHFVDRYVNSTGTKAPRLAPDALSALERYRWPGNVRELLNLVNELCSMEAGNLITVERLRVSLPDLEGPKVPVPIGSEARYDYNQEREIIFHFIKQLHDEVDELKEMIEAVGSSEPPHVSTRLDELQRQPHRLTMSSLDGAAVHYDDIAVQDFPADDMPQDLGHATEVRHEEVAHHDADIRGGIKPLDELKRRSIEEALNEFDGNRRKAAEALGISERTLYRKIKQYGLE